MSSELRQIVAYFVKWLENERPPWDAYRTIMSGRLIGLDKHPIVRPVGTGETYHRMMVKCMLKLTGME